MKSRLPYFTSNFLNPRDVFLLVSLLLHPLCGFAQWPTEPQQGINPLPIDAAYCIPRQLEFNGSEGLLLYYIAGSGAENGERIYLQELMADGTLRWETEAEIPQINDHEGYLGGAVLASSDSAFFVAWRDFTDSDLNPWGQPVNDCAFVQKISLTGERLWGDEGILVSGHDPGENMSNSLLALSPQSDGGVSLLYKHQSSSHVYYYVQRWSNEGIPAFEGRGNVVERDTPELLGSWYQYKPDDEGGFYFLSNGVFFHINGNGDHLPNSNLSYMPYHIFRYIRSYDSFMTLLMRNDDTDDYYFVSIDSSGTILFGIDRIQYVYRENNANLNISMSGNTRYSAVVSYHGSLLWYLVDQDFNPLPTSDSLTILPDTPSWSNVYNFRYGPRLLQYEEDGDTYRNYITGGDTLASNFWSYRLHDTRTENYYRNIDNVFEDPEGNTWVFWYNDREGGRSFATFNVINRYGTWGTAVNAVDPDYSSRNLPSELEISLWPNPTNGWLRVSFNADFLVPTNSFVEIYNLLGQTVSRDQYLRNMFIECRNWPSGFYSVVLHDTQRHITTNKTFILIR